MVVVVTLSQQYNTGEKPTIMVYTYIDRRAGTPDKNKKQKHFSTKLNRFIYSNSAIDLYTIRAYSLEHKKCYNNVVIGKEKYIYIAPQAPSAGHRVPPRSRHIPKDVVR